MVEIVALLISAGALTLSWLAFKRAKKYQEFEHEQRLQISGERISESASGHDPAFSFSANLENRGLKPIDVKSVWIDYGHEKDESLRYKYHVKGQFYLPAGDSEVISFSLSSSDFFATLSKFKIDQCFFFLRIELDGVGKETLTKRRRLTGIGRGTGTIVVHSGETL